MRCQFQISRLVSQEIPSEILRNTLSFSPIISSHLTETPTFGGQVYCWPRTALIITLNPHTLTGVSPTRHLMCALGTLNKFTIKRIWIARESRVSKMLMVGGYKTVLTTSKCLFIVVGPPSNFHPRKDPKDARKLPHYRVSVWLLSVCLSTDWIIKFAAEQMWPVLANIKCQEPRPHRR